MPKREKYLFVIAGPTAVGKTKVALEIANHFGAPIISADSRQIYKELAIGTAKPTQHEIESGPIHLVNHVSVTEDYSAGRFEREAIEKINEMHSQSDIAVLSGGTGLYIDAVLFGLDDFPEVGKEVLITLENELANDGPDALKAELQEKDPDYFDIVDPNNSRRVLRALSVIRQTGKTFSSFRRDKPKTRPFKTMAVILERPRERLYERINQRVDDMIANGLIEEVQGLKKYENLKALQTVGYQELFPYLDGQISLEEAVEEIKKYSRRYAKRQLTWLRRYKWPRFSPTDLDKIIRYFEQR
ncbi:MAG: tRNA (adenosine(37)-N6)-dimethylallyltransferase MiaA [Saprospiraceae bacterium]|nr:tRNA (adenosine(37)-N6)-dimethylallyltransferase MiaA [Saprospiraceae bacterium]